MKILARMRAFGMTPVLPAFAGFVPNAIRHKYPDAAITRLGNWGAFTEQYCCVNLLDPQDRLFRQIGQAFVQVMAAQPNLHCALFRMVGQKMEHCLAAG